MPWYHEFEKAHEKPFVTVTPGRHPFEVTAFAALFIIGLIGALTGPRTGNLEAAFPRWVVVFIYGAAAFWSAVGLFGLGHDDQLIRLRVELIACRGIAAVVIAFVATAGVIAGIPGLLSSIGVAWVAVGASWRGYQIRKDLKLLQEVRKRLNREPLDGGE